MEPIFCRLFHATYLLAFISGGSCVVYRGELVDGSVTIRSERDPAVLLLVKVRPLLPPAEGRLLLLTALL